MSGKNQHVVPHNGNWGVKAAGSASPSAVFETQKTAIDHARHVAREQRSELFIHGRNGRIRERDSYGNDPFPPRG